MATAPQTALDNDGDGELDEGFADTDRDGVADCVDGDNLDQSELDGDLETSGCATSGARSRSGLAWMGWMALLIGLRRRPR